MDIQKRFDRILQLYFLLQSKAIVPIEELQRRFTVSKRTIYRDIQALEKAGVPIVAANGSYAISEGFRVHAARFTQEEMLSLLIAEKMMERHQTAFIKQQFESVLTKVKSSLRHQQKITMYGLDDRLQIEADVKVQDYLPDIMNILLGSVASSTIVAINYHKRGEQAVHSREIEPVGLFFERDYWYVLAFCLVRSDYRSFRLDRIRKASMTDTPFTRKHQPLRELRENLKAVPSIHIVIKVDQEFAHFLFLERDDYGFYEEHNRGKYVEMHFNCMSHPTAFVRWFLRFIDVADIMEPSFVKVELLEIVENGLKRARKNPL